MRERPILFSAQMVRALLDGSKTQTRRVIKLPKVGRCLAQSPDRDGNRVQGQWEPTTVGGPGCTDSAGNPVPSTAAIWHTGCARILVGYTTGERLWVKEAIRRIPGSDLSEFIADGEITKADAWPWKPKALPGMYCPRGLSRITLEVTDVRVEHVQDISAEDSLAEGVPRASECGCEVCRHSLQMCPADASEQILAYRDLWDHINGKREGCGWEANPWVWALTFKRVAEVSHAS